MGGDAKLDNKTINGSDFDKAVVLIPIAIWIPQILVKPLYAI